MSMQTADELLLNGETVALFATPLSDYLSSPGLGWPFASRHTANVRGYVATWEVRDGTLLLVGLRGWLARHPFSVTTPRGLTIEEDLAALAAMRETPDMQMADSGLDGPEVPLSLLFPGNAGPVAATWFSGTLRVPRGKRIASVGLWGSLVFERELRIAIENGVVTGTVEVNPAEQPDELQRFALAVAGVALPARADAEGWVQCPGCEARFRVADEANWDGERHRCGCRIELRDDSPGPESPHEA